MTSLRRLLLVAIAVVAATVGTVPATATVAAAEPSNSAAEQELVRLLNAERAKAGLVAVRVDARLTAIARARSADMVAKDYFSHQQPDGRNVFDLINAAGIAWYGAGEIIAWNNWPTLMDSAAQARNGWMASPGHRAIVLSTTYNYVGIGLAVDPATGKKLWTGVFLKGPDRTGGWVQFRPVSDPGAVGSYRTVAFSWRGGDIQLPVLTAGFHHYQVQVRTDDGSWRALSTATTTTSRAIRAWTGHTYRLRVRACDRAGNCGSWVSQTLNA